MNRSNILYKLSYALFLVILFYSCTAPPRPVRTFDNISSLSLLDILENIFKNEGFLIADKELQRGYLSTDWKEYEGDKHGFARWVERIKFEATVEPDRTKGKRVFLILRVSVEERAPVSSDWRMKDKYAEGNPEYRQILVKIDNAVSQFGGIPR